LNLVISTRKLLRIGVLFFMMFSIIDYADATSEKKFELKISGGISYLAGTDFDPNAASEKNSLDWGKEISGEILFHLSRIALCGGVGYINGKSSSESVTSEGGAVTATSTSNLDAKAIPLTLGIYYFLPVSSKSQIFLHAGAGYYFVSFERDSRRENDTPYWIEVDLKGNDGDFGFHGGIGFEYAISENIIFVIEGAGRYAKIKGYEGTRNRNDSNGWSDSTTGEFYTLERFLGEQGWQKRTNVFTEKPSGDDVRNVRTPLIDFSGFTVRIGIKLRLF
jgi:hypothetical protein